MKKTKIGELHERILRHEIDTVTAQYFIDDLSTEERERLHNELVVEYVLSGRDVMILNLLRYMENLAKNDKQEPDIEVTNVNLAKNEEQEPLHFYSTDSDKRLTSVFNGLKKNGYFDEYADITSWLYICKGGDPRTFKPLNWNGGINCLAWLVEMLFTYENNKWVITSHCFTVKGDRPKTTSMKSAVSKIKTESSNITKNLKRLEDLLK